MNLAHWKHWRRLLWCGALNRYHVCFSYRISRAAIHWSKWRKLQAALRNVLLLHSTFYPTVQNNTTQHCAIDGRAIGREIIRDVSYRIVSEVKWNAVHESAQRHAPFLLVLLSSSSARRGIVHNVWQVIHGIICRLWRYLSSGFLVCAPEHCILLCYLNRIWIHLISILLFPHHSSTPEVNNEV